MNCNAWGIGGPGPEGDERVIERARELSGKFPFPGMPKALAIAEAEIALLDEMNSDNGADDDDNDGEW